METMSRLIPDSCAAVIFDPEGGISLIGPVGSDRTDPLSRLASIAGSAALVIKKDHPELVEDLNDSPPSPSETRYPPR
jgi:hypothetical protein